MIARSYTNPRTFDRYRLYLPGWWDIVRVLEVAGDYVTNEPVIINTPALAGDWELGYCNYTNCMRALAEIDKWFAEVKPVEEPIAETAI